MRNLLVGIFSLMLAAGVPVAEAVEREPVADNWHQWRGPRGDGVAPYGDPPVRWSEDENVKWKTPIPGEGSGSPIVWNDRVYVVTAVATQQSDTASPVAQDEPSDGPTDRRSSGGRGRRSFGRRPPPDSPYQFTVLCIHRETGQIVWQTVATEQIPHEGRQETNTFASASPTTDGEHIYASFGSRGIFCLSMQGDVKWSRDLGDMQTRIGFGEGSSPALHQDTLVVSWDHEGESFIIALDAESGETKWKVARDERTTWATPLIVEHQGRTQVVANGSNRVRSYDLQTGDLIWECGGQVANPIPSPVSHQGIVYCMTGYRGYAVYAIPLNATGDITDTDQVVWQRTDFGPYIASPVLYDGLLYLTKSRDALLSVLDADNGESVTDPIRLPSGGTLYASLVAADDRIYVTNRNGTTVVLEHGTDPQIAATNQLDEGIDASPAIAGKQMFLRSEGHLYCLQQEPHSE